MSPGALSNFRVLRLDFDGQLATNDIKESDYAEFATDGKTLKENNLKPETDEHAAVVTSSNDGGDPRGCSWSPLPACPNSQRRELALGIHCRGMVRAASFLTIIRRHSGRMGIPA